MGCAKVDVRAKVPCRIADGHALTKGRPREACKSCAGALASREGGALPGGNLATDITDVYLHRMSRQDGASEVPVEVGVNNPVICQTSGNGPAKPSQQNDGT
eukprot:14208252-Alexandrium_andersonii.AAC.1